MRSTKRPNEALETGFEPIVLVGDIHFDPKCETTVIREHIVAEQKRFMEDLATYMLDNRIKKVVFTGDIFTNRRYLSVEAMNDIIEYFEMLFRSFEVFVISGNHDNVYEDVPSDCSLRFLTPLGNTRVFINNIGYEEINGYRWYFVPWLFPEDMQEFYEWLGKIADAGDIDRNVIVGHFDIYGALMEAGQVSNNGIDPKKLFAAAGQVFSGHYHCRSELVGENGSKITYLGTPYQLSFAHVGTDCGYYVLHKDSLEFRENTVCPKFVDVVDTDMDNLPDLSNCFVRYFSRKDRTVEDATFLRKKLEDASPIYFKTIPYGGSVEDDVDTQRIADDEETKRILSSDSLGIADIYMERYPEKMPELHSGKDPKEEIRRFLREYTEKR